MKVQCKNFRPRHVVPIPEFCCFEATTKLPMGVMMNWIHWCLDDFWNEEVKIPVKKEET